MTRTLEREVRLFEVDEAERMLPLVRSILAGMRADWTDRQRALERLDLGEGPADELRREADAMTERLVEAAAELQSLGVELKGLDPGLVDFPALRDGEIVYLCWRQDEERIAYWHPPETGYAGRRPLEID